MAKKVLSILSCFFLSILFYACDSDDNYVANEVPEISPVVFDITQVPYATLSEYNFFEGDIQNLNPVYGVLPYDLRSTLFSDYAKKKRFIWMPNDVKANYISDSDILDFPIGTVLIKNFYYNNVLPENKSKILETRLMIKKDDSWIFANYIWNDSQTEAVFDLSGSVVSMDWNENSITNHVEYRIPSESRCHTCHKTGDTSIPIGPKPRNLFLNYNYEDGSMNQLQKWAEFGYLNTNYPSNVEALPKWDDTTLSLDLRARAYLEINCAHCHSEESHCAYRPVRFNFNATSDPLNMGVCVVPDTDLGVGLTYIVEPRSTRNSVLFYRLNETEESVRMPLLARTLRHQEGIELIEEWINSLNINCN
ncbi:hypothetical protein Q4512_02615 [Oceanihabitans sp. 2_MG-2023]|uniref:hypothetical protein n=1 Tax=Oceanihabitans sp. 2_MG-2023 TaxID=3062661 RepID=UPI0026E25006|nr:hypothetical protein [Oceanihabitans sp. 2_MG-2023]MDO6595790.1 hypothetical protein [Oceanihabitans sp. 2_MG-2023]